MCVSIVLVGGIMTCNGGLSRLEPTSHNLLQQINWRAPKITETKLGGKVCRPTRYGPFSFCSSSQRQLAPEAASQLGGVSKIKGAYLPLEISLRYDETFGPLRWHSLL